MPECSICNVKIHIEVPILLFFFALIFSDSVRTNLIIFRTCYVTLGYNKSDCALLGSPDADNNTAKLEEIVEPYAAVLNMVHNLIDAFFSGIICLFLGPWSDRFGRKPILITPLIGFALAYVMYVIFAILENVSPWYSLLCFIPVGLSGGASSYMTVALCYVSEVTTERSRGLRMGVFEAILALGIFLGNISSSYVFAATNYPTVFAISGLCCLLGALFTMIFIRESLDEPETEGRFKGLFRLSNITDMVKTTFKRRGNFDRLIVFCCVLMLSIYILVINGESALTFLFVREKFNWSLRQYTLFSAAHNIVWVLGTVIGTYLLHKLLKISEIVMIPIGFLSMLIGMVFMGFAKYDWEVYGASFSRAFGGVISPMVRTLVSKIVPNEEVGKIFALIVVSESLIGMGGSPLFTVIYNATILTDPAIFCFVAAGIYLIEIVISSVIIYVRTCRTGRDYEELIDSEIEEVTEVVS